jgi:hypothetical protein
MKLPALNSDKSIVDMTTDELMLASGQIMAPAPDHVRNSKPIDPFLTCEHPSMIGLIDDLISDFESDGIKTGNKVKLARHLRMILSNFIQLKEVSPTWYVSYSRSSNTYSPRYYAPGANITYRPMINAVDGLKELGLVEHEMGVNRGNNAEGVLSRMRATPELNKSLISLYDFSANDIIKLPSVPEVIILKDSRKREINYADTIETHEMRALVSRYNDWLRDADIIVPSLSSYQLNLSLNQYHRIFNNGSFEQGGRFYGPWWQGNKEVRPNIRINGNRTAEFDFGSLIAHQVYSLENIRYFDAYGEEADPYSLPEYGTIRPYLKTVFHRMLNNPSEGLTIRSIKQINPRDLGLNDAEIESVGELDIREVLADILAKHEVVKHHFYTNIGIKLQYLDSQICERIIKSCLDEGMTILTIHDSFIVEENNEEFIRRVMEEACVESGMTSVPTITKS